VGRLRPESSKYESSSSHSVSSGEKLFFNRWNSDIQRLTNKRVEKDIIPTYKRLCAVLIEREEFAEVITAINEK